MSNPVITTTTIISHNKLFNDREVINWYPTITPIIPPIVNPIVPFLGYNPSLINLGEPIAISAAQDPIIIGNAAFGSIPNNETIAKHGA